jgi:hypothetical protein
VNFKPQAGDIREMVTLDGERESYMAMKKPAYEEMLAENERLKKQLDIAMKALEHLAWQPEGYQAAQQAMEDVEKIK